MGTFVIATFYGCPENLMRLYVKHEEGSVNSLWYMDADFCSVYRSELWLPVISANPDFFRSSSYSGGREKKASSHGANVVRINDSGRDSQRLLLRIVGT